MSHINILSELLALPRVPTLRSEQIVNVVYRPGVHWWRNNQESPDSIGSRGQRKAECPLVSQNALAWGVWACVARHCSCVSGLDWWLRDLLVFWVCLSTHLVLFWKWKNKTQPHMLNCNSNRYKDNHVTFFSSTKAGLAFSKHGPLATCVYWNVYWNLFQTHTHTHTHPPTHTLCHTLWD